MDGMARSRYIKPGLFENDEFEQLQDPDKGRLLFLATTCLADRNGCLRYRPRRIAAFAWPYRKVDAIPLLREMAKLGFYEVIQDETGEQFLRITKFLEHQSPHPREPEITTGCLVVVSEEPDFFAAEPDFFAAGQSRPAYGSTGSKKKRKEGKKEERVASDRWFEASFWPIYPLRAAKDKALTAAWVNVQPLEREQVIAAVKDQLTWPADLTCGLNPKRDKLPHASTWLNQRRWEDERPPRPGESDRRETERLLADLRQAQRDLGGDFTQ